MDNEPAHFVTIEVDNGELSFKFRCAEEEGAPCRLWCDEGCEYADEAHESHKLVDQGECTPVVWLENSDGDKDEQMNGRFEVELPAKFEWEGEDYSFRVFPRRVEGALVSG